MNTKRGTNQKNSKKTEFHTAICRNSLARLGVATALGALMFGANAFAGGIIVDNDEWTLSDSGFSAEGLANGTKYTDNAAAFLAGGSGSILIYSDNFSLTESDFHTALTDAGYSVTTINPGSTAFGSLSLSSYKAIFLGGDNLPSGFGTSLSSYVHGGGGVYIAAGTGTISGGAPGEAAQWNGFLNGFGLNLASQYNGIAGDVATSEEAPVLSGVSQLFYDNGNTVNATGGFPGAQVITFDGNQGLIGTVSFGSSVPDPASTLVLLGLSTVSMAFGLRLRRLQA